MAQCRICEHYPIIKEFKAIEMMFGTRDEFDYLECEACKSIQIKSIPSEVDLSKYYPKDYYSYSSDYFYSNHRFGTGIKSKIKQKIRNERDRYALGLDSFTGSVIDYFKPAEVQLKIFRRHRIETTNRILDVGCGNGSFLNFLASMGFEALLGIDPYTPADRISEAGVLVRKIGLADLDGIYDVIMFHHALEHVVDPIMSLRAARGKISDHGLCVVRIPTTTSYAREFYRENWVQLDAPRHLNIPSRKGMEILGIKTGFKLIDVIDDSTDFQFWASEQYRINIPMNRHGLDYEAGRPAFDVSRRLIKQWRKFAIRLNQQHRGDQAAFIFKAA